MLRLQLFRTDDERISLAVRLLDGTALQWFVNLSLKNQRPSSWNSFTSEPTLDECYCDILNIKTYSQFTLTKTQTNMSNQF